MIFTTNRRQCAYGGRGYSNPSGYPKSLDFTLGDTMHLPLVLGYLYSAEREDAPNFHSVFSGWSAGDWMVSPDVPERTSGLNILFF